MSKIGLWNLKNEKPKRLKESSIQLEKDIEDWIVGKEEANFKIRRVKMDNTTFEMKEKAARNMNIAILVILVISAVFAIVQNSGVFDGKSDKVASYDVGTFELIMYDKELSIGDSDFSPGCYVLNTKNGMVYQKSHTSDIFIRVNYRD